MVVLLQSDTAKVSSVMSALEYISCYADRAMKVTCQVFGSQCSCQPREGKSYASLNLFRNLIY